MSELESLRKSQDFHRVLSEGRRSRQGAIVMVGSENLPGPPRLGLVVSRRTGNAVTRNRIKRRLRHAIRAVELQPGNDYVIIANSQVADVPFSTLQGWLGRASADLSNA